MNLNFPVKIAGDRDDGYTLTFTDFQEIQLFEQHIDVLAAKASGVLKNMLTTLIRQGQPLPEGSPCEPGQPVVSLPEAAIPKCCVYEAMKANGIDADRLAFRLQCERHVVDALLDLEIASRFEDIAAAFKAASSLPVLVARNTRPRANSPARATQSSRHVVASALSA